MEDKPEIKLTRKQERFCEEYVVDWNATRAAIRAGYSEDTAAVIGSENLRKPYIEDYIEEIREDISKLCKVTAIRNVQELAKIAYSTLADYYTEIGTLKPLSALTEDQKAALSEITKDVSTFEGGESVKIKIKLHDKLKALDMLGKAVGANGVDKIEHSGTIQSDPISLSINGENIDLSKK